MIRRTIILAVFTILTLKTIWADVWVKTEKGTQPKIITEQVFNEKAEGKELQKRTANFSDKCPYKPVDEFFTVGDGYGKQIWHHYVNIDETDYWEMISYGS